MIPPIKYYLLISMYILWSTNPHKQESKQILTIYKISPHIKIAVKYINEFLLYIWWLLQAQHYRLTWHKNNAGQLKSVSEGYHSIPLLNSDFCSMRELDALLIPVPSGWDANSSEIRNWHFARLSEQVISRIHGTFHYYWSAWNILQY